MHRLGAVTLRRTARRVSMVTVAVVLTALVFAVTAIGAAGAMTLTFVRHAESQANADGIIDTSVPGPDLSAAGQAQAAAIVGDLIAKDFDGFYASDMVRTQQTAAPLIAALQAAGTPEQLHILAGLHEIDAGIFEGSSEDHGIGRIGYVVSPFLWVLGARFAPLPGSTDADGNAFDERVDDAVETIYDSGDQNAVAFAHGATIMFWVLMNVDNPDIALLLTHQLDNTESVVITGSPDDGWTLVNWGGVTVDADPSFATKMFVDFRNWVTPQQTSLYELSKAIRAGDLRRTVQAIGTGLTHLVVSTIDFGKAVVRDVVDAVHDLIPNRTGAVPVSAAVATGGADESDPVTIPARPAARADLPAAGDEQVFKPERVEAALTDAEPATTAEPMTKLPKMVDDEKDSAEPDSAVADTESDEATDSEPRSDLSEASADSTKADTPETPEIHADKSTGDSVTKSGTDGAAQKDAA